MTDPLRFVVPPETTGSTTATDEPGTTTEAPAETPAATPAGAPAGTPEPGQPGTPPAAATPSAAEQRFQSCRWRKAETPAYCSHPEVQPFAGTNGFKPDSWCPGCAFYKLRRNPRRDY